MSLLDLGNTPPSSLQFLAAQKIEPQNKYETTLTIPAEFPQVLKDFAREVLYQLLMPGFNAAFF